MAASTRVLHALEESRAFRVTWLLCELGLASSTTIRTYNRIGGKKAEEGMKEASGFGLGKSPVLVEADGLQIVESGNILQYLAERYPSQALPSLLPTTSDFTLRTSVFEWLHFSESLMTHALPCIYVRWFVAEQHPDLANEAESKMGANVVNDLRHIEGQLEKQRALVARGKEGPFIASPSELTIADFALVFSVQYVLAKRPGLPSADAEGAQRWPEIEAWLGRIEARPAYKQALKVGAKHSFSLTQQQ